MKKILILLFLVPLSLMAQHLPDINLTFGNYIDDQVEHKFISKERVWNLHGNTLDYSIDANDLRYVDTLILNNEEVEKIKDLLLKNEPLMSVNKELKSDNRDLFGVSQQIRGEINFNGKVVDILITINGYSIEEEDKDVVWLEELEQLFYEIVENHR